MTAHAEPRPTVKPNPPVEFAADPMFRWLVTAGSSASLGGMVASLAAVDRGPAGKLVFEPNLWMLPLFAIGAALGWIFWKLLWRAQAENTPAGRRRLRGFAILLAVVAMGSFSYPLRFLQPERRFDVFVGLGLAIVVLSSVGMLIYRTIRWMEAGEPKDGETDGPDE